MKNFGLIIAGVAFFFIGLIWMVGSGEAGPISDPKPAMLADTVHINLDETPTVETDSMAQSRETLFKEIKKFNQVVYDIKNRYMEDVDTRELINAGIRGMLEDLDRFSVLLERKSYDQLMESTSGKYEGLGMEIDSRDDHITIVTPMEGTPAYRKGLRSGDQILEIDGHSTYKMTTADAAKLMRGTAGTVVNLKIQRTGDTNPMDFEVERAVIELKSVNYYGVIDGTDIGYIRLSRFAEETSRELREALTDLNSRGVNSLIFDLRSNGGGLLQQAVETSELFIEEGKLVVYTKGKFADSERRLYSKQKPLYPDKPLVILVNQGTASASEIVAGAIQDWDRGVIMGYPTYGKGLVQQIFTVGNDGDIALKLTTAKYYVPSGRCIQRPDHQDKVHPEDMMAGEEMMDEETDTKPADTLNTTEKEIYYTNGGRIVYGGGGILPDMEIKDDDVFQPIEIAMERKSLFFDYAVKYFADHPDASKNLEINDKILDDFKAFTETKAFDYKTSLEFALDELKSAINDEGSDSVYNAAVKSFESLITQEKKADFEHSREYIQRAIKREIVSKIDGQRGVYEELILKSDPAVKQAVELLKDKKEYTRVLTAGKDQAMINKDKSKN